MNKMKLSNTVRLWTLLALSGSIVLLGWLRVGTNSRGSLPNEEEVSERRAAPGSSETASMMPKKGEFGPALAHLHDRYSRFLNMPSHEQADAIFAYGTNLDEEADRIEFSLLCDFVRRQVVDEVRERLLLKTLSEGGSRLPPAFRSDLLADISGAMATTYDLGQFLEADFFPLKR